jgi:hypothetical protein
MAICAQADDPIKQPTAGFVGLDGSLLNSVPHVCISSFDPSG